MKNFNLYSWIVFLCATFFLVAIFFQILSIMGSFSIAGLADITHGTFHYISNIFIIAVVVIKYFFSGLLDEKNKNLYTMGSNLIWKFFPWLVLHFFGSYFFGMSDMVSMIIMLLIALLMAYLTYISIRIISMMIS